jgi:predicted YcjX-like family ATPase
MVNVSWLPPVFADASSRIVNAFKFGDAVPGSTVWLAVTGLSRSGKTVFITSLIHNLLSALHNPNRMPLLRVIGDGRLIAARLDGAKGQRLPKFPYFDNIEVMAEGSPDWPARTDDISEIGIDVHFEPTGAVAKFMGQVSGAPSTTSIRIIDYPGEWLLDLPLLGQTYAQWSRGAIRHYRRGVRAEAAGPFMAYIGQHPHSESASDQVARQAHDLYCAFLRKARDRHALSFLQPGRFLCPGGIGEVSYLWFAPLDVPDSVETPAPGTLAALMADRFEVYKREAVGRFYEDHFRRYSRQIVLVDVLRALLAGRDAFDDTRLAVEAILQSFRYGGGGGILGRLLRGSHIDKVLFAATKADHVPEIQRDHLAALLKNMAAFPAIDVASANAQIDTTALASVISTTDDVQEIDGQRVQVVVGRPVGAKKQAKFFVGNVPIKPPRPDAWEAPFLNVPLFEPPAIDPSPVDGIAHINLDFALEFLLGDRLR